MRLLAFVTVLVAVRSYAGLEIGVCSHLTRTGFVERDALCAKMADAGFRYVRVDFDWCRVEKLRDEWDFGHFDAVVLSAEKYGLKVLPILTGAPDGVRVWEETARWSNFVSRTVSHYRGRIPAYEIWNEQNTERFWHSPPNATNYLSVLHTAYIAAKSADPKCSVVIGGFSNVPFDFIEEIYSLGGRGDFDIMAVHPYDVFHEPEHALEQKLRGLRELMTRYGDVDKPIWITEIGWPSGIRKNANPPFDRLKWTELDQARFVSPTLAIARRCGVEKLFWFEFRSHDYDRKESYWGIVHSDLSEKPAYRVFVQEMNPTEERK